MLFVEPERQSRPAHLSSTVARQVLPLLYDPLEMYTNIQSVSLLRQLLIALAGAMLGRVAAFVVLFIGSGVPHGGCADQLGRHGVDAQQPRR